MKSFNESAHEVIEERSKENQLDQYDRFKPLLIEVMQDPLTIKIINTALAINAGGEDVTVKAHMAAMLVIGIRIGMKMEEWEPLTTATM